MLISSRKQSLSKTERLYEKKAIDALFNDTLQENQTHLLEKSPVKLLWKKYPGRTEHPVKAAFSVPRKSFKKAVDRNLLKRRMREAYRKNKQVIYELPQLSDNYYHLMFIYSAKQKALYPEIESKIVLILQRLASKICGK